MIESSQEILRRAIAEIEPYAIVSMISGGKDSLCAFYVAKELGIPITHIMHGITRTGIPETTDFVRHFAETQPYIYLEADAGSNYEDYVRRKGFFGVGIEAHRFTYHLLKSQVFRYIVSKKIRFGKRNRPVLFLNGARQTESANRNQHLQPIRKDDRYNNYWVSPLFEWSKEERDDYLDRVSAPINPVTVKLCRSGECLCGTTQSKATREEAAFYFPSWGKWLNDLEKEVKTKFGFGWGENSPKIPKTKETSQFMCVSCIDQLEGEGEG